MPRFNPAGVPGRCNDADSRSRMAHGLNQSDLLRESRLEPRLSMTRRRKWLTIRSMVAGEKLLALGWRVWARPTRATNMPKVFNLGACLSRSGSAVIPFRAGQRRRRITAEICLQELGRFRQHQLQVTFQVQLKV